MFKTHAAFAFGALLVTTSISNAFLEHEACQEINAWNCGSGAYVEIPTPLDRKPAIRCRERVVFPVSERHAYSSGEGANASARNRAAAAACLRIGKSYRFT